MNATMNRPVVVALLVVVLMSPSSHRSLAQTFRTLYSFTATDASSLTNADGANPYGTVVCSGNTLYGTAKLGGTSGNGAVFAVNTDGTGFRNLHSFSAPTSYTNSDGTYPTAGLVLAGDTLFGTTAGGGEFGGGTVFAVNTAGTGFTNLHSFTAPSNSFPFGNYDGELPAGVLCSSDRTLFGTARQGGASGNGTVFAVSMDGTGFTNLHNFSPVYFSAAAAAGTNNDGLHPSAGLVFSGSRLYGTAVNGGNFGSGTVFAMNLDGTGFTNLHSFSTVSIYTNADGQTPSGPLTVRGSTLYGTTVNAGLSGWGTVFAVDTNGTGFTTLHSFSTIVTSTNNDGANPYAGLALVGNTLYATTLLGGAATHGTAYAIDCEGNGFTTLFAFAGGTGGYFPNGGLVLSSHALYGTLAYGGDAGNGSVFSLSLPPRLSIGVSAGAAVLAWPTNFAGFDYNSYVLESSDTLGPSAFWRTNAQPRVVIDGRYTVINQLPVGEQYFRLSR